MTAGWYPDPANTRLRRYWDGIAWSNVTVAAPAPGMTAEHKRRFWGAMAVLFVVIFGVIGFAAYYTGRPVHSVHSDDPAIEAFYRQIESDGFGNMRMGDAQDRAKEACGGNGLVLWGIADYSMADSFRFSAAAMQACDALGA